MTAMRDLMVHPEWLQALSAEFDKPYMQALDDFLCAQRTAGRRIYPPTEDIFRALNKAPPSTVRVVILGQDPYHGAGQAQGLCFSVARDRQIPPSLRNIFLELAADIACPYPSHGCLGHWAEQGVLLLNSVLTVEHGLPGSHHARGWEQLTNAICETFSRLADELLCAREVVVMDSENCMVERRALLQVFNAIQLARYLAIHESIEGIPFSKHPARIGP